jgi:hypothetical protein
MTIVCLYVGRQQIASNIRGYLRFEHKLQDVKEKCKFLYCYQGRIQVLWGLKLI